MGANPCSLLAEMLHEFSMAALAFRPQSIFQCKLCSSKPLFATQVFLSAIFTRQIVFCQCLYQRIWTLKKNQNLVLVSFQVADSEQLQTEPEGKHLGVRSQKIQDGGCGAYEKRTGFCHLFVVISLTIFDPMGIMDIPNCKNDLSECSIVLHRCWLVTEGISVTQRTLC